MPKYDEPLCPCGLLKNEHRRGPCPACQMPLEHHPGITALDQTTTTGTPDTTACWRSLARMADARQHAGHPLTPTDAEALHLHPQT